MASIGTRELHLDSAVAMNLLDLTLSKGGAVWLRVKGGSMESAVPRGSEVRVQPLGGTPKSGDVVLAWSRADRPVLHRVRRVHGNTVLLRGDNMLADDPEVPVTAVIGLATHVRVNERTRPVGEHRTQSLRQRWQHLRWRARRLLAR